MLVKRHSAFSHLALGVSAKAFTAKSLKPGPFGISALLGGAYPCVWSSDTLRAVSQTFGVPAFVGCSGLQCGRSGSTRCETQSQKVAFTVPDTAFAVLGIAFSMPFQKADCLYRSLVLRVDTGETKYR